MKSIALDRVPLQVKEVDSEGHSQAPSRVGSSALMVNDEASEWFSGQKMSQPNLKPTLLDYKDERPALL